mgnify:CR=1 FL=1
MAEHNIIGKKGEEIACETMQKKGFRVVDTNWKFGHLEMDVIAMSKKEIAFVEVKTRRLAWQCQPMDVLTPAKIRNIVMAADAYVGYKRLDMPVRYDLITVSGSTQTPHICHYEEAFYSPVWYR